MLWFFLLYFFFQSDSGIRYDLVIGVYSFFFFFQAEDGIRDDLVTGVQTCALPIYWRAARPRSGLPLWPRRGHRIGPDWNQPQLCSGAGCEFESAESDYRRSLFRHRAGSSDRYELSLAAWPARHGNYPLRQPLSRPWRHPAGFPPDPSRGGTISR